MYVFGRPLAWPGEGGGVHPELQESLRGAERGDQNSEDSDRIVPSVALALSRRKTCHVAHYAGEVVRAARKLVPGWGKPLLPLPRGVEVGTKVEVQHVGTYTLVHKLRDLR
eukprot:Hpha_TRINITY_DN32902_c0_g1::TRINITY_DN32902_c0_g1_i1::g.113247::m.113247